MQYKSFQQNHVIFPGREDALKEFINKTYNGQKHKIKNSRSSHSEDALTWSCFDVLRNVPFEKTTKALNEILEDAYEGNCNFSFDRYAKEDVTIEIGKEFVTPVLNPHEKTEVDASIETPDKLIFIEAKLYSSISLPDDKVKYNQIARKMRVGLDVAQEQKKEFYFIFLDIAPMRKLYCRKSKDEANDKNAGYDYKWKSAWWFHYYKNGRSGSMRPLREILEGINHPPIKDVAKNMGWITWSDMFKITLRAVVS